MNEDIINSSSKDCSFDVLAEIFLEMGIAMGLDLDKPVTILIANLTE